MDFMLPDLYPRPVLLPWRIIADSRDTRRVVLLHRLIALILLVRHNPQVAHSVVQGVKVDMVDFKPLRTIHKIIMELLSEADEAMSVIGPSDAGISKIKDQYRKMKAFAWGYYLTEAGNKTVHHLDIYTDDTIYRCKRSNVGWEVLVKQNPIGKIPVLMFEQEVEHEGVQPMIERTEALESTDADVNDRFANPAMVATSEILNSLPKAEDEAKLYILKNGGKVEYLTWDQASQSKQNEYDRLDKHILSKSFTPNIDFDNMKSLSNLSAKAIRKVMLLAVIKAEKRKETHDGYMNRHANIMLAILGNVLDYSHKAQYEALMVGHEFQEPFGDDVSDTLNDILKQFGAGGMSTQTMLELSYLIKDAKKEYDLIKQEQAERMEQEIKRQQELNKFDVFGQGE